MGSVGNCALGVCATLELGNMRVTQSRKSSEVMTPTKKSPWFTQTKPRETPTSASGRCSMFRGMGGGRERYLESSSLSRTNTSMDVFGAHVWRDRRMSAGVESLMWKAVYGQRLNTLTSQELRYLHLVLCKMYGLCLNVYLLREAVANAGNQDDVVLGRKVPREVWKFIYDGCVQKMGITHEMLVEQASSAALWLRLNSKPELLAGLSSYILHRLGVRVPVTVAPRNLKDGNYLYTLGGVLPGRLLMRRRALGIWGRWMLSVGIGDACGESRHKKAAARRNKRRRNRIHFTICLFSVTATCSKPQPWLLAKSPKQQNKVCHSHHAPRTVL
ncbi:uncharacterized protein LOC119525787 isoform X3 [Choloepus didactylus]|uniref:uncharacterized protein LOC119525785 isoform X3 n=1 Tax=Choloepus didactylus TaxID=27675 RepID=UPI0018A00D99|nr:uncharacterized protein LOC119525785 isoform X3 [Choloepus didactylus]XP_037680507.1 uncharacterized protein LOC119525787 isoform X3 [Choloepus didactylus]